MNLDILPKADYGTTMLKDGDQMEIVHFVGGGC
ncbi:sulfur carrier protein ThiS [Geotalea toluenoxydans]